MAEKSNGFVPITAVLNDPEKLAEALKERQALARARREAEKLAKQGGTVVEKPKAPVVKLPVEVQEHRTAPNICLRSALFGVVKLGQRKYWPVSNPASIAAQAGYRVLYSGEQLNQSDLDVWLAVKFLCMPHPLGAEVRFTAPELFQILGWQDGKRSRESIQRSLRRLADGYLEAKDSKRGFGGHLIDWWAWEENSFHFCVVLSPKMAPLFGNDCYTLVDINQRQQLRKDLSRWLHSYWSSHDKVCSIKDTTLRELCGSEAGNIRHFRAELRCALQELETAGFLEPGWDVSHKGLVTATKTPTAKALRRILRKIRNYKKKN